MHILWVSHDHCDCTVHYICVSSPFMLSRNIELEQYYAARYILSIDSKYRCGGRPRKLPQNRHSTILANGHNPILQKRRDRIHLVHGRMMVKRTDQSVSGADVAFFQQLFDLGSVLGREYRIFLGIAVHHPGSAVGKEGREVRIGFGVADFQDLEAVVAICSPYSWCVQFDARSVACNCTADSLELERVELTGGVSVRLEFSLKRCMISKARGQRECKCRRQLRLTSRVSTCSFQGTR